MCTPRLLAICVLGLVAGCAGPRAMSPTSAVGPAVRFGEPASAELIAAWDISIAPTGAGLPPGAGDARQGAVIYQQKCASCHGEGGRGTPADPLVGGVGSLATGKPMRTVGSYWPYATTLFDYMRRAMPLNNPMSLSNDEVYAVSAYLLHLNGLLGEEDRLDATTLWKVKMPNREGFISDWPQRR